MEEVTEKKGRGGARAGSGRKKADIPRQCRSIYCNDEEMKLLREVLHEIRRIDAANKDLAKAKGKPDEYRVANNRLFAVADAVKGKTIAQLVTDSGAILPYLKV